MALKWGVLGAGSVAQRRAMPAITKAEDAELYALLSRDGVRAQRLATEHGAQKYYTTVDELLVRRSVGCDLCVNTCVSAL